MNRELIVNVTPAEMQIALCEDKVLVELNKEQCQTGFAVGDIYLGKVRKIMPGLNAAFVNIGHEKDAFIHYSDLGTHFPSLHKLVSSFQPGKRGLRVETMKLEEPMEKGGKIASYLQVGQLVMVQVAKEAISTKGPRLTAEVSLPGRNVVLVPFSQKVFLSQKIRSSEEKRRLKRIAQSVLPKNFGVIIRTAAVEATDEEIERDIRQQLDRWFKTCGTIRKKAPTAPGQLLSEMSRANTIIRDSLNGSFSQIVVNDEEMFKEIQGYVHEIDPSMEKIVKLYKDKEPIFDHFEVTRQIKSSFGKVVPIKQGAYLVIEHTEALHVIDVNSGIRSKNKEQEQNTFDINCYAAEEIARQLRLRDMGGIVIVDFIDMESNEHRNALYKKMTELMESDRAKHNVLPLTKFGLMQITRQRVRPATEINTQEVCPVCNGTGKISSSVVIDEAIERRLSYYVTEKGMKRLILKVSPILGAYLTKGLFNSILGRWKKKYGCKIELIEVTDFTVLQNEFYNVKGEKLD